MEGEKTERETKFRPEKQLSYMFYTKYHSPMAILHSPSSKITRIGERSSASFPTLTNIMSYSSGFGNSCETSTKVTLLHTHLVETLCLCSGFALPPPLVVVSCDRHLGRTPSLPHVSQQCSSGVAQRKRLLVSRRRGGELLSQRCGSQESKWNRNT